MAYGDKRDYRKIDIYVARDGHYKYVASTTWAKTLKEAKARYWANMNGRDKEHASIHIDDIKCKFAEKK